jgi:chromosome condensin MukBEF complex kleisin-like MukF subunit
VLSREFEDINGALEPLKKRENVLDKAKGVVSAEEDATLIKKYITQVEQAVASYQVCLRRRVAFITTDITLAISHERHIHDVLGKISTFKLRYSCIDSHPCITHRMMVRSNYHISDKRFKLTAVGTKIYRINSMQCDMLQMRTLIH